MRAAAFALAAIACVAPGLSCGGSEATPGALAARAAVDAEPRWEDVLDTPPELLAIVFPTALRRDKVYGPLLRRAIDLVREQSRVVAETRALDAMEDAEEVIIGIRPDAAAARGEAGEVVVVVRGVRADVDPATLVDADGHPLWSPGPGGRVRELVRTASAAPSDPPATPADSPVAASLFELPGRTWLIASGSAREHARAVFARPLGRPGMRLERFDPDGGETLILLRIDGPSLVARVRALQPGPDGRAPPGALGTLGRHLEALTLELAAGSSASDASALDAGPDAPLHRTIRASLSYTERDAAAQAEATARDVIGAIGRKKPDDLAWLASATVDRPSQGAAAGTSVIITAPLPSHLVGALLHAGAARLEAPPPSP